MGLLFSRLGRYVTIRGLIGIGVAMSGVLLAILLVDLVEQMRTVGTRTELSITEALRLTLLKTPMLIEQTLPFIVLAGVMMSIIGLNRSSELIAMRAAGISAWRFLAPSAFLGLALGVLVVTALNPLGAYFYRVFEGEKSDQLSERAEGEQSNGVWIRQGDSGGQVVIHADAVDSSGATLLGATFIFFEVREEALRFTRRIRAERAELKPGFWQLSNLVEATPGARPIRQSDLAIPTTLDATELIDRFVTPATLSFWALPGFIAEARAAGFAPIRYELKWQSLLAYPPRFRCSCSAWAISRVGAPRAWGSGFSCFFTANWPAPLRSPNRSLRP